MFQSLQLSDGGAIREIVIASGGWFRDRSNTFHHTL